MKPPNLSYAGRLERFLAYLVDTLFLLLLRGILQQAFGMSGMLLVTIFVCDALYFTLFMAGGWQASPGMRMLSIQVIKRDGRPLNKQAALERFLAFTLPSLPVYTTMFNPQVSQVLAGMLILAWVIPIVFTAERTGIHDILCNTRVITGKAEDRKHSR